MANTVDRGKLGRGANRKVHGSIQSQPGLTRERYWFGTDEEVGNREIAGDNPGLHPPPRFQQIVAGDTNKDMNQPSGPTHNADLKFSSGPGA